MLATYPLHAAHSSRSSSAPKQAPLRAVDAAARPEWMDVLDSILSSTPVTDAAALAASVTHDGAARARAFLAAR